MSLLTKVASGIQYGDVSNVSVRNILTIVSAKLFGGFTEQDMEDTLEFFQWKCPYTGIDLKERINKGLGGYVTDHIVPQNKDYCGLNIKGNLVIADKKANDKKGRKSAEEFLLDDSDPFWKDTPRSTRKERLNRIHDFQKQCGYNPTELQKKIGPLLIQMYADVRKEQEKRIDRIVKATGIEPLKPIELSELKEDSKKIKGKRKTPEIVFNPSNLNEFKQQLILTQRAVFTLIYDSGRVNSVPWNAGKITEKSLLIANIESKTFWRNWKKDGLVRVEVSIEK